MFFLCVLPVSALDVSSSGTLLQSLREVFAPFPPNSCHVETRVTTDGGVEIFHFEQRQKGAMLDYAWERYRVSGATETLEYANRGIWTGQQNLARQQYKGGSKEEPVQVFVDDEDPTKRYRASYGAGGLLWGDLRSSGLDMCQLLAELDATALRTQSEQLDGEDVTRIEFSHSSGQYEIWVRNSDNHTVVKMACKQGIGDVWDGRPIGQSDDKSKPNATQHRVEIYPISMGIIDGVHVFVGGKMTEDVAFSDGSTRRTIYESTRSNIQFNPDFEAMGAFVMDGIPDGTRVFHKQFPGLPYVWRQGRFVMDEGAAIVGAIDEQAIALAHKPDGVDVPAAGRRGDLKPKDLAAKNEEPPTQSRPLGRVLGLTGIAIAVAVLAGLVVVRRKK